MRRKRNGLLLLFTIALFLSGIHSARAQEPPQILYFYSETCEHCLEVNEEFIPGFLERWGDRVRFVWLEVTDTANLDSLYAMESRVDVPEYDKEYPALYFMGTMLEGEIAIRLRLEALVERYIANPDSAWAVEREVMSRTPEIIDASAIQAARTVHIAYFYEQGCSECSRAEGIIDWLENLFGSVSIDRFDIADEKNKLYATALGIRTGIPENRLMSTPQFFVGDDYLLSEEISRSRLAELVRTYSDIGAPATWEALTETELAETQALIRKKFESFSVFAIALAGLGDGINPCAFATILFLVSYLGMVGRKRDEILLIGLSFAAAVFITYFFVGLGFFRFIDSLTNINLLADIIFGGTALLCLVFGIISISDYTKARAGKTSEMALQLPKFLKLHIHRTIRERARTEGIVAGALVAGFTVSILELACTGQIYLPTIIFMVGSEGYTSQAFVYLLLYNICFIIPLLAVFAVVYYGVSSKAIGNVMAANVGVVKLILAAVFFTVGGLLTWTVLH